MQHDKSTHGRGQPAQLAKFNPALGDLTSMQSAVDWLCHMVEGLDRKLDRATATQHACDCSSEPVPPPTVVLQTGSAPPGTLLGAEEHNHHARLHNKLAQDGNYVLMPLRDELNRPISSFPRTLAILAFTAAHGELFETLSCFRIPPPTKFSAQRAYIEFVGVNFAFAQHVLNTYTFPPTPSITATRAQRDQLRASAVEYAQPPTSDTPATIESAAPSLPSRSRSATLRPRSRLNARARARNRESTFLLQPLRDSWGLVVASFPKDLFDLFHPVYRTTPRSARCVGVLTALERDVRFLLREYGMSDAAGGCERRWVEYVGVAWEWRGGWLQDSLVFPSYTVV